MAQAEKKAPDWVAIEGEYRAGVESVSALGKKYGISHTAINKRAKANGWTRNPEGTKRAIVKAHFSGVGQQVSAEVSAVTAETIRTAALDDIVDMERGLRINRMCLVNLETAAQAESEPRSIKVIVEATSAAIDSIRKIRGLDDPAAGNSPAPSLDDFYGEPSKP